MPSHDRRGLWACAALLFFGLASALAIEASMVDGKLPYNTTTANLIVELVKLVSMLILTRMQTPPSPPTGFTLSLRGILPYSVPGLMYAVQNQLVFHAVANLQPAFFQLASKMKFVSTAVFARVVMKKTLTIVQWIGIVLLMLALVVSKSHMLMVKKTCLNLASGDQSSLRLDMPAQLSQGSVLTPATVAAESSFVTEAKLMFGLFLVTCTSTISGASGIANEFLLKHHDEGVSMYIKNAQLYFWGVLFNGIGSLLETGSQGHHDPFQGFNQWTWLIILLRAVEGISISFIMMYMDNIVKCFVSAALVYTTALASYFMFDEPIDAIFMLGLAIASLALILYFGSFNEVLNEHSKRMDQIAPDCSPKGDR